MYSADLIRMLFDHNRWALGILMDRLDAADAAALCEAPYPGTGSPIETLRHLAGIEAFHTARIRGADPEEARAPFDRAERVADVRRAWMAFDARFRSYLDGLDDAELGRTCTFIRPDGEQVSRRVGNVLAHVIMHSAQHRAELAMLATRLAQPPGELGLSIYLKSAGSEGSRLW